MSLLDEPVTDVIAAGASAGGAFAAVRWVILWFTGRMDKRQASIDAEHDKLDMGWKTYREQLEKRLDTMERQNRALRLSFEHVAGALIRTDPTNEALAVAERIMARAFPDDFSMTVTRLDAAGGNAGA